MGLIRRIARKVLDATRSPSSPKEPGTPAPTVTPEPTPAPAPKKEGDQPWYLDGQNDGWDDVNPGEKKKG